MACCGRGSSRASSSGAATTKGVSYSTPPDASADALPGGGDSGLDRTSPSSSTSYYSPAETVSQLLALKQIDLRDPSVSEDTDLLQRALHKYASSREEIARKSKFSPDLLPPLNEAQESLFRSDPSVAFLLTRSKNLNTVVYRVLPPAERKREALSVNWVRFAEEGQTKALNWIERTQAFGIHKQQRIVVWESAGNDAAGVSVLVPKRTPVLRHATWSIILFDDEAAASAANSDRADGVSIQIDGNEKSRRGLGPPISEQWDIRLAATTKVPLRLDVAAQPSTSQRPGLVYAVINGKECLVVRLHVRTSTPTSWTVASVYLVGYDPRRDCVEIFDVLDSKVAQDLKQVKTKY